MVRDNLTYRASAMGQVVRLVALLNLANFGIEFAVALSIGSISLFADSVDYFEGRPA